MQGSGPQGIVRMYTGRAKKAVKEIQISESNSMHCSLRCMGQVCAKQRKANKQVWERSFSWVYLHEIMEDTKI